MMDKNGRIKGKFNIIDAAVILLVIVVIIGLFVRFGSKMTRTAVNSQQTFKYTIKVTGVRDYTVEGLKKKGYITDKKSTQEIGEITDVSVSEARMQSTTADGKIIWSDLPDRYECSVTVVAHGRESEDGYLLNDGTSEVAMGKSIDLITKYVKTSGEISSIELINE